MAEPSPEALSQPVLSPLTTSAVFLVVTVDDGGEGTVRDLLEDLSGLRRSIGFGAPGGRLSVVAGIGSQVWDRLFDGPRPALLHPFEELTGPRHRAPATPGDLLFHIRATRQDLCFGLAVQIMERLRGAVTVRDEVHGFTYLDVRDLLGFVDGTENPVGAAATAAVLIGDEDPGFAGGSYVIVQKYLHDMDAWNALTVEQQELVIGRSKMGNIEMDDDTKPADSHVARTTVVDADGTERQILRDNMPFGAVGSGEFGTYFIGYARTPQVTETMLRRMFLGDDEASHDRILDFSTAVTGTLFFAPPAGFLDDLPDPPAPADTAVPATVPAPQSLGIGDLRKAATP
ncbi:Dyp-type peroxidase [Streptomyces sp. NPDC088354]|uniref:Dyp-type peroxidase n=1 Tax=unclassified Streptomyces TaxID=2593676 RepID=UPI0029A1C424|nr:Dyp-type peroxidase [Streptomyces sp. MI02-7b]MDX3075737.1 Dyp-type peroxidase [Streptomyces sp. MI02-7b]